MLKSFDEHYLLQAHCDGEGCRAYLNFQVDEGTKLYKELNFVLPIYNAGKINQEQLKEVFKDFRQAVLAKFVSEGWLGISNAETYCPKHKENHE